MYTLHPPLIPHPDRLGSGLLSAGMDPPVPKLCSSFQVQGRVEGQAAWGRCCHPPQLVVPTLPSEMTDSLLEDLIAAHLVLPNRVTVPVKKGLDVTNLRFPLPCVSTHTGCRAPGPELMDRRARQRGISSDGNAYFCPVRAWHPILWGQD